MRAIATVGLVMLFGGAWAAERGALRDGRGTVIAVTESAADDAEAWTRVEVAVDGDGSVVLSVGPSEVLRSSGFGLAPGNVVRFRYFTGPAPFDVQRIRNESTGAIFRARCLHGDPTWFGREGRHEGQGGGPQHRGSGGGRR